MRRLLATLALLVVPGLASAQSPVTVSGNICTATWTASNTYVLVGRVFVTGTNCLLTIEPGTVVKGRLNADPLQAAALIVTRGARINASGTAAQPIIFTAEQDDLTSAGDLRNTDRGLWGGVVILGRARINVGGGTENVEGIDATDPRGLYGCGDAGNACDDADNSGTFRYVSIRHGGTAIGNNNELNGLTMGGVGSGTTIEYVETFAIADDGFEWFGGTVNTKYLVSAFNDDDAFDYDEGFRGKGQFWFAVQPTDRAGSGGEFDGGTTPEDGTPFAIPTVYNATLIGAGPTGPTGNDFALSIDDNAGGKFYNSIFTGFRGGAITIEDAASGEDTFNRFLAGDLVLQGNYFWDFGAGNTVAQAVAVSGSGASDAGRTQFRDYVTANNTFANPQLRSISRTFDRGLDPRPADASPAASGATASADAFFTPVTYRGAFAPSGATWLSQWTFLDRGLYLNQNAVAADAGPLAREGVRLAVSPNPATAGAALAVELPEATAARVAVYDVLGREVAVVAHGTLAAGTTTYRLGDGLPAGVYIARLTTARGATALQFSVVR